MLKTNQIENDQDLYEDNKLFLDFKCKFKTLEVDVISMLFNK